ncbi:LysR family transcriptional regulator [Sneathiella chungangensis]|uniref:LysR family transcriptional regulator n=2 Tax=Sneathiella chungangensis TaxID=1418234 RepID=A0A845MCY4_9PROT|nr:LysR family transcriptional regulator [Sneathiella chungangensis]
MNFRQIETFRAVMMAGSASRAADLLQITQPAISRAIAELERSLGFPLFNRIRGRLVPTPEGEMFFRDVKTSFRGLDSLRTSAARIRDLGSGQIRIASIPSQGSSLVPRAIAKFREEYPSTAITLQIASSARVRNLVYNGHFDIGLAAEEIDTEGMHFEVFTSVRAICAVSNKHPLSTKEVIRPQDLDGEDFIAFMSEDSARQQIDTVLNENGINPNIVIETPYAITVAELVKLGIGIGLTNPLAIESSFDRSGLSLIPFDPPIYLKSFLLLRSDKQKSMEVKAMINKLLESRFS